MSRHLDRLRRGQRWWAAEAVMRAMGLALLGGCDRLALFTHRMATSPPPHQATVGEFVLCLAILVLLTSGLALTLFGPGLLEEVPIPQRSAWCWKER